jgi:hypothetical protein
MNERSLLLVFPRAKCSSLGGRLPRGKNEGIRKLAEKVTLVGRGARK